MTAIQTPKSLYVHVFPDIKGYINVKGLCLGLFVPLKVFVILGRNDYRWKIAKFDRCSAPMVIEQWGFFSLWQLTSVYNGHFRGPVTLTPIAERLALELSLIVLTTRPRLGYEHPIFCRDEGSRYKGIHVTKSLLIIKQYRNICFHGYSENYKTKQRFRVGRLNCYMVYFSASVITEKISLRLKINM